VTAEGLEQPAQHEPPAGNGQLADAGCPWLDAAGARPHIAIEELGPLIPAMAYRPITVGEDTYWCFTLTVLIRGMGKVCILVSFEHETLTRRQVVLVTNRVDWSAAKIIRLYVQRWPTAMV
jgi:hypothetical protein